MVVAEVVTRPRGVGAGTKKVAFGGDSLELVKKAEKEGETITRTETRGSLPSVGMTPIFYPLVMELIHLVFLN